MQQVHFVMLNVMVVHEWVWSNLMEVVEMMGELLDQMREDCRCCSAWTLTDSMVSMVRLYTMRRRMEWVDCLVDKLDSRVSLSLILRLQCLNRKEIRSMHSFEGDVELLPNSL